MGGRVNLSHSDHQWTTPSQGEDAPELRLRRNLERFFFMLVNGGCWDGRCPGMCCRGGQAMKTEIIWDWRWVFFWGRHAVQTEIPSKVWIYGRVVESTWPNLFHLFWRNLAFDFFMSLLQTEFIMIMMMLMMMMMMMMLMMLMLMIAVTVVTSPNKPWHLQVHALTNDVFDSEIN